MRLKNSKNALLWIFKYSKSNLPWVVLLSVITGIISFGYIYLALVSKRVLDIATKDVDGSLLLSILEICWNNYFTMCPQYNICKYIYQSRR